MSRILARLSSGRSLNTLFVTLRVTVVEERTGGRVEIQMTSFAELGLAGPDTLRLIGDRTLEFGEV